MHTSGVPLSEIAHASCPHDGLLHDDVAGRSSVPIISPWRSLALWRDGLVAEEMYEVRKSTTPAAGAKPDERGAEARDM